MYIPRKLQNKICLKDLSMNKHTLIKLLHEYHPTAPEELVYKDKMLTFIENHDDCFERSLAIGHITGSAWLLNKDQTQALIMHHAKLNRWVQLGGHCDGNPNVLNVAIKEAQEESGIKSIVPINDTIFDIDIHLIPANSKEKEHFHYDVRFLLQVTSNEHVIQNSESKELRWIGKNRDELPSDEPSVNRLFNKWVERY